MWLRLAWALLASSPLSCTSEGPAAVFVAMDYQLRCLGCEPRTADDPAHTVYAVDGEAEYRISCTRDRRGGLDLISVTLQGSGRDARVESGFAFEASQFVVGTEPGESCRVTAREGRNIYEGRCSAAEPSADIPCQVSTRVERGVLFGHVHCEHLPNRSNAALDRALVLPGSREAAEFEVHGCPEL